MKLILVGGFLGAGKTTLLWESAKRLTERGLKVGLITNDQVPELVDTAILTRSGAGVVEVAGSCFCCNFEGFSDAIKSLIAGGADCILAEPVGSCTDLSATIVQPLKELYPEYEQAPLSVVADPVRLQELFRLRPSRLHADAAYILRIQLQEADQILLNKVETLSDTDRVTLRAMLAEEFPDTPVAEISALSGAGVEDWLTGVLESNMSGARIAEVDYDRYANGEAVLGWLNAAIDLRWIAGLEPQWENFVRDFFAALQAELRADESEVGHIKMLLDCTSGTIAANLTALHESANIRVDGSVNRLTASLTVNARVQIDPEGIERAFRSALANTCYARVSPTIHAFHCIQPGRPVPTHRYDKVVS